MKLSKTEALSRINKMNKDVWYAINEAGKALQSYIDLDSNREAIVKEHDEAIANMLAAKKELETIKSKVANRKKDLDAKLKKDAIAFENAHSKHAVELKASVEEGESCRKDMADKHKKAEASYNKMIKNKEAVIGQKEAKIKELNNVYESAIKFIKDLSRIE